MISKEYKYYFTVPTCYQYKIVAENEEQAREILVEGGIQIDGQWYDCPSGEPLTLPATNLGSTSAT